MAGSFLDTTVVVHVADITDAVKSDKARAEAFIRTNQPAEAPFYALRELLVGHIKTICDAHNFLLAAQNSGEAMMSLSNMPTFQGRKVLGRIQALATAMNSVYGPNPSGSRKDDKRELLGALALRVNRLWRKAHRMSSVSLVQSLACFNDGRITRGPMGELRGPGGSFNCVKSERCAAAAYIYDNKSNLTNMIAALHPKALNAKASGKTENESRRRALKELSSKGPVEFNKQKCRALGDAYFAALCPAGSTVLTSNIEDHDPLCKALNKKASKP